jgi:hypothetical protein
MIQVKNISTKLLIICFMLGFGLFFGVDVAQKKLSNSTTTAIHIVATPTPHKLFKLRNKPQHKLVRL